MKVEWRYTETGQKVRISLRSGRIIPLPIEMHETIDYKEKHLYIGKCVCINCLKVTMITDREE